MGFFTTSPKQHKSFGYKPNFAVKSVRALASFIISVLRLNGSSRLAIEIRQMLNSYYGVEIGKEKTALFKCDHGRLLWRANSLFDEEEMIIDWINSFSHDDVFYDIGANVGMYSVYAALTNEKLKVFSFEPELNNVQTLYENLYINRLLERCVIVPYAADCRTRLTPFFIREFTKGGAFNNIGGEPPYAINKENSFTMQCLSLSLDDFVKFYNPPLPTKVKIDVDGHEPQVLEGMRNTLKHVSELYIELDLGLDAHQSAFSFLQEAGFVMEKQENTSLLHNSKMSNYLFINKNRT